jgi:aspartokinase-like uncharacterized kinase
VTSRNSKDGGRAPIIVKLGGSLTESGRIASILKIVSGARKPCVVVPGGGIFADAVRAAQAELEFSDAVAHRMALLAMHQTGLMLAALQPRLRPAETLAGIRRALADGKIPVWLPLKLAGADDKIPADWSITSDGLAARLAERLGGAPVVLVKSCHVGRSASLASLTRDGLVDGIFAAIVERAHLPWWVLGAGDEALLAELLEASRDGGRRTPSTRAIARRA